MICGRGSAFLLSISIENNEQLLTQAEPAKVIAMMCTIYSLVSETERKIAPMKIARGPINPHEPSTHSSFPMLEKTNSRASFVSFPSLRLCRWIAWGPQNTI